MDVDQDGRTLFVANLHKNVDEELLYELFLQAGPVERVCIPTGSNKNYRYGFVTYRHKSTIDYAIDLYKGTKLFKSEIVVKRKGERSNNDHQSSDRCNDESSISSTNQDQFRHFRQSYTMNNMEESNENGHKNFGLNIAASSLKGHWSKRTRYDNLEPRRHPHLSRPSESRDWQRNHRQKNNMYRKELYRKSYKDRKGNY